MLISNELIMADSYNTNFCEFLDLKLRLEYSEYYIPDNFVITYRHLKRSFYRKNLI